MESYEHLWVLVTPLQHNIQYYETLISSKKANNGKTSKKRLASDDASGADDGIDTFTSPPKVQKRKAVTFSSVNEVKDISPRKDRKKNNKKK